jgi:hypothetical protein
MDGGHEIRDFRISPIARGLHREILESMGWVRVLGAALVQEDASVLDALLRQGGVRPAPAADSAWADRLFLDPRGEPRAEADRAAYAVDPDPTEKPRLVDRPLAEERFERFRALRFRDAGFGDPEAVRSRGSRGAEVVEEGTAELRVLPGDQRARRGGLAEGTPRVG